MADSANLLNAYRDAARSNLDAALATVVRVVGSAYRRPGARMLILSDGRTIGSISGGCLERDVAIRSQALIESGQSSVLQYSTMGSDDDIIFGLGVGCNGSVEILIEPLAIPKPIDTLELLESCYEDRRICVLGTVFGGVGLDQSTLGTIIALHDDTVVVAEGTSASLIEELTTVARRTYESGCSETVSIFTDEARYDLFLEYVQPPIKLMVCGAGSDAVPVCSIAKQLGWHVVVVDHRHDYASSELFTVADRVLCGGAATIDDQIKGCVRTAMLIMTHNYSHDFQYLKRGIISDVEYLGLLGPKQRTLRLLQELKTEGVAYTSEQFKRLHAPVGLDLGAESEQEIALSVVSEVQAAMSSRRGGFLRDKNGPIHSAFNGSVEVGETSSDVEVSSRRSIPCPLD